jgi:hypothetical protein
MPDYDARTADEIRADGDEMSVLNAYTEAFTGNSQPGQVNAAGESIHGDYGEQDFPTHEDDPRWYEDAEDDSYEPEQPAAGQFDTSQIAQQVAEDWAAARLDPNQAMAQQFVGVVDQRIQAQLEATRQAQEWAAQGEADRQARAEFRQTQQEANDQEYGTARLNEIAQATAQREGLPPIIPEHVHAYAEELYGEQALAYSNAYRTPEEALAAMDRDQIAERCVQQAAIDLGRKFISNTALKRI